MSSGVMEHLFRPNAQRESNKNPGKLLLAGRRVLAVHFRMLSRCIVLVFGGLQVMTECNPSVMRSLLVIARFVMPCGLAVMFGSMFVMLRCLFVMLVYLGLCHPVPPKSNLRHRSFTN